MEGAAKTASNKESLAKQRHAPRSAHVWTETQREYLAWRADPDRAGNKKGWAMDHGVSYQTVRVWETMPWYTQALDERLRELHVDPDRIGAVMQALWVEASGGNVQAAKLYMEHVERLRPTKPVHEDRDVEQMSDEELAAAWAE